jgi:hypothetical protein
VKNKTVLSFSMIGVLALAAAACRMPLSAQTTSVPLPATAALATQTLTATPAATNTSLPPSQTPTGTSTPYPTITPAPTITITPTITPLRAGPTPTQQYACQLIDKYPDNWATFKAHSPFEARWTLKNTGTRTWKQDEVILKFVSGVEMYATKSFQTLSGNTEPDKLALLIVDMISPKKPGEYASIWGLFTSSRTALCTFTVKITVK